MADKIQWAVSTMPKSDDGHLEIMPLDHVKAARAFHRSFRLYTVTPLARLDGQAARLGLSSLCVKDESYRFGLNAFKVLGGSLAMANCIAAEGAKVTIGEVNYDECVRMAAAEADACERGVIVQDAAWEGYEKIPSWIMEGNGTMASEAAGQLREMAANRPTHVFVQAGVGSTRSMPRGSSAFPTRASPVAVPCFPRYRLYRRLPSPHPAARP